MIVISSLSDTLSTGLCHFRGQSWSCQLGRTGRSVLKREGDGATPTGLYRLEEVYYRPDRMPRPQTRLPVKRITAQTGWCDDPADRNYNRPVTLPYPASHEKLWRDDHVYDLLVTLSHNTRPRRMNFGSAVFLHLSTPAHTPTQGCIALDPDPLARIIRHVATREYIWI